MSNALEIQIAKEIRARKLEVKLFKRKEPVDTDELITKQSAVDELLEKYNSITDGRSYAEKIDDIAFDFCEEYFYELSKATRDEIQIGRFYDLDATLSVVGKDKFIGKLDVVSSIVDKFRELKLIQTIEKVTIDPSMCKGGVIHFECVSKLKINDDEPRKIMQMIDLIRSSLPTTYPYVIKREYFVVQDARPLFHWPEKKLVPTKHDNWEPQFKPKVVERPKSAQVVVPLVVEVAPVVVEKDEEEENEDEEEGGEDGEAEAEALGESGPGEEGAEDAQGEAVEGEVVEDYENREYTEGGYVEGEYAEGDYGEEDYAEGTYADEGDGYDTYEEENPQS